MKILIIDDEPSLRHTLSLILHEEGHSVVTASDGQDGLTKIAGADPDLVLCDVRMPTMGGMDFLSRYQAGGGTALVVMMSAYGDADSAVAAMQRGAYDYVQKPFRADEVVLVVRKAVEREKLRVRVESLEKELTAIRGDGDIVGRSQPIRTALELARKVARHRSTVLIAGESGTGKELVARLIHRASPRAAEPFVAVNCGAIPEALLESELFGHVKGAFTGADADKPGLFEEAHGGSLLLDEIGELPAALQVKLLRALQEGEVRRVGATTARTLDVRVIAASNRDLAAEVGAGRFRSDLYYRLNVVTIPLPALRDRSQDIPELALHFLHRYNTRLGLNVHGVSPAAMRLLVEYDWPGNVRELEHVIERALILATGSVIEIDDLPEQLKAPGAPERVSTTDLSIRRQTDQLERRLIKNALERTRGNRTRAARLLELSHRALLYKIRDYGLGE